ncbi:MAG: PAS domain-containing protein, partial [Burkholderiales bacterium]
MNAPTPAPLDQATRLLIGQKEILEGIVAGRGLADPLTAICLLAERESGDMLCSILLLDPDGVHLRHGAAPSLEFKYSRLVDGLAIGPAVGSCGTAAFRREQVIVEDIATDPLWAAYRDVATIYKLRACWSTPIFNAARQVLGTFAMYYRQPRRPSPEHAALIEMATQTAAIAIEHHRTIEKLSISEERFLLVSQATNDAVWDWDFAQNTLWWNDKFTKLFGYPREELEPGPESWTLRIHPDEVQQVADDIHAVIDGSEQYWSAEYRFRRRDGSYADIFDRGFVIRDAAGKAIRMIGAMQDITQRKQAEGKIRRLNRVYAVLSGINTLIVRVRDRQQLFNEACRIAAEQGGFGMAWIGLLDPATGDVIPAAWSGATANDQ